MKLTLYLIRHGLSCCNIRHHKDLHLSPLNAVHKDPLLSNKGVEQSKKGGKFLESKNLSFDLVLCSSLIRAIETALCMFPNNNVEIAPYICEKRCSLENKPYNKNRQKKRLKQYINGYERVKHCSQSNGLSDTNLKKFIQYLLKNYSVDDKNIAIVTHSIFLMEIFNIKERMNNNSVFKVVINTDTYSVDDYTTVFSGYKFPDSVSFIMTLR